MPAVLITGCSSGFGLATARHFATSGWNVVATMRSPDESVLPSGAHIRTAALDVTDPASIASAVEAAGLIDALVNNAGIGLLSAVEGTPMAVARASCSKHAGYDRHDAGRAAADALAWREHHRQCHLQRDAGTLAVAGHLHRQQGSGERTG